MRFSLYRDAHKAIRLFLSEFSLHCGRINFSNAAELKELKTAFNTIYDLFMIHSDVEDKHILPLLKEYNKSLFDKISQSHEDVHHDLDLLKEMMNGFTGSEDDIAMKAHHFYLHFNAFHAKNLSHLDDEENDVMPIFWSKMDDPSLLELFGKIRADIPPELMSLYMKYMIQSLRIADLAMILKGVKATAPEAAFTGIMSAAKGLIAEQDYSDLKQLIG